jgi:uncharacterized protein
MRNLGDCRDHLWVEGLALNQGLLQRLRTHVAKDFGPECVAHDISHLDRVWHNCLTISAKEGGDRLILGASAYFHDYHRVVERRTGTRVPPEGALDLVEHALALAEFPQELRARVLSCVATTGKHVFSGEVLGDGLVLQP